MEEVLHVELCQCETHNLHFCEHYSLCAGGICFHLEETDDNMIVHYFLHNYVEGQNSNEMRQKYCKYMYREYTIWCRNMLTVGKYGCVITMRCTRNGITCTCMNMYSS